MQPARNINANYKTQHNTDKTFAKREEAFPFILHNVAIKMEKKIISRIKTTKLQIFAFIFDIPY